MANNRYKATATLAAAAAGFFVSYPYQHTFWGALLTSGFSAAMVGGLADWYAVTALFRKPLQIPYRTAIIPKNRERLFKAIIVMVEEELLTADNIRETLNQAGLARLTLHYAAQDESRQQLHTISGRFVQKTVDTIDAATLAAAFELLLTEHEDKVKLAPLAGQALDWSLTSGFADELIDLGVTEIKQMFKEEYMTGIIATMYSSALNAYAAKQNQHKLMGWILENLLNLDPVTVAGLIQEQAADFMEELYRRDHHLRQRVIGQLVKLAEDLQTDVLAGEKVEAALRLQVVKLIESLGELPADHPEMVGGLSKWMLRQAAKLVGDLTADEDRQARFDALLVDWLVRWVDQHHGEIGRLVASYLSSFSDEELVDYIESKVMDDLQMIRINGSIVGGFVGIGLFLITYALGVEP
ncbi:Uncharacterized membrane-anchored protein YjiN, DUF445 family [Sporomusa malonica]|uniref:Uncharacterized membrane-anchored protein YjiN, DUF445 family n=2 Tax=Sporomusa malonica TaxID=112901 RepID=A0A1W2CNL5_9FIRM|nr:Uncharacterized membrane-anchored protein YjiN, DUF445 family [Sporomusa malonica]